MANDDLSGPPAFHSNADDSPRDGPQFVDDEPGLQLDRWAEPRRARGGRKGIVLAVAGAAVIALGVGLVSAASLANRRDAEAAAAPGPALQVDASPREPAPLPQAAQDAGKLDVLPDLPPTPHAAPPQAASSDVAADAEDDAADTATAAPVEPAPLTPPFGSDRAPRVRADCADAPSRIEAMICAEPALAAADVRMKRAYVAALRNGAPPDLLGYDQDEWLAARDEAARHSVDAVADIYRERIAELRDIAANGW